MFSLISIVFLIAIFGLPLVIALLPAVIWGTTAAVLLSLLLLPITYPLFFTLVAGGLSLPFQSAIVPGTFPRDLRNPIYIRRRLYGLCWTALFYFKPIYWICLTIPSLKWLVFRLFGYRGSMAFTVYPDSWIRDLPLLKMEEGVYVANRATLGTNIALSDGTILVDAITLGRNSTVGHLTMLAPGARLGAGAEVGVGCAIGIRTRIGRNTLVQPRCAINHHARVGDDCIIGTMSYVGHRTLIANGLNVPPASLIGNGARIFDEVAARAHVSSATPHDPSSLIPRAERHAATVSPEVTLGAAGDLA